MITILCDTREQRPYSFSDAVKVERGTLDVADYAIRGLDRHICVERKSVSDLLGSITSGRDRFIKELRQLSAFRAAYLVVEGCWSDLERGAWDSPSRVHPSSVVGSLLSFSLKYRVIPILAESHDIAGRIVERLFLQYAAMMERDFKLMTKINGG